MLAGSNISPCEPILMHVGKLMKTKPPTTSKEMVDIFVDAFQTELRTEQERSVLSLYDLKMPSFLKTGLKNFGDLGFSEIRTRLEQVVLDCEFCVVSTTVNTLLFFQ